MFFGIGPSQLRQIQKSGGLLGHLRQHRREIHAQRFEGINQFAAHFVQARILPFLFGQIPRLVGIHIFVHRIGQGHDVAQGAGVFAVFVIGGDGFALRRQLCQQGAV